MTSITHHNKILFDKALYHTLHNEGLYSNDPIDPGGETFMGISRAFHPLWNGWVIIDNLKQHGKKIRITDKLFDAVKGFYYEHFWLPICADNLAHYSDLLVIELFDTAVNLGKHRAIGYLQEALNLLNVNQRLYPDIAVDGIIGRITLSTVEVYFTFATQTMPKDKKEKLLLNTMNALQNEFYINRMRQNPEMEKYRGWLLR